MSLPADITPLVTNLEIVEFVAGMKDTIGVMETIVIESAVDMIEDYCQRRFISQVYTDEPYFIRRANRSFDGYVTDPVVDIRLKQRPVTALTAIKLVTSRDPTTGAPVSPTTLPGNYHRVDLSAGIVSFYSLGYPTTGDGLLIGSNFISYPSNTLFDFLITYTAGYTADSIPARLKQVLLMMISRLWTMAKLQVFHLDEVQNTGMSMVWMTLHRSGLTPEEQFVLDRFKTPMVA